MTAVAPIRADPIGPPTAQWASSYSPLLGATLITFLITAFRLADPLDSDVSWQLWVAQRLHEGAHLYTDIIELNPPLWYWMAVPVERTAALLNLRIEHVLIAATGMLALLSLTATNHLAGHVPSRHRTLLLAYGALILAGMPWVHVGQREHLLLIATVPYAALIAARREGVAVDWRAATLVGLGGALGFALKHYFLILPFLLELWLLVGQRRRWRPLRPETLSMVAVGGGYTLGVLLFAREFLTRTVPLVRLTYGAVGARSTADMLGPFALVGLVLLASVLSQARTLARSKAPLASALTIAAIGVSAVYFIQFKGWAYHALPMVGFGSLAIAAVLAEVPTPRWLKLAAPTLLMLPLGLSTEERLHPSLPDRDLFQAVAGLRAGDRVAFITTESAIPWSVTLQGGYRYASRYSALWMMRAIVRNEQHGDRDARLDALGRAIVAETADDFTCTPPERIIVSRPKPGEDGFDLLPFFLRDPRFGAILSHYRPRSRTSLETFVLASPLPRPSFQCRRGT